MMKYRKKLSTILLPVFLSSSLFFGCNTAADAQAETSALAADDKADASGSADWSSETESRDALDGTQDSDSSAASMDAPAAVVTDAKNLTLKTISYDKEDLNTTWDEDNAIVITLDKTTASASKNQGIAINDNTITINASGTYVLTGTLTEGQIRIDAGKDDLIHLVLNNADITNSSSSAIYGEQSGKIILTLADGSANVLTDASAYVYEDSTQDEPNAALFSRDDLIINGTGSLKVSGNYQDGIRTKDDLTIISGTIDVKAAQDGIKGKDSVIVKDARITVDGGNDGIKASNSTDATKGYICIEDGTFHVTSGNDGIQAETLLQITGGSFELETGGTSANGKQHTNTQDRRSSASDAAPSNISASANSIPSSISSNVGDTETDSTDNGTTATSESTSSKGLKSGSGIYLTGGTFHIDSADDSIHTNGSVHLAGGTYTMSTGDDGIHADYALLISKGTVTIEKSYEGLEGTTIHITGGDIHTVSSDDGLNAAGGNDSSSTGGQYGNDMFAVDEDAYIRISDGTLYVDAEGDGIDSNGNLYIDGGTTLVCGSASGGNGSLDFNGTGEITGGVLLAAGSINMAQALSDSSTQASILVGYDDLQTAGTLMNLTDSSGQSIVSFVPSKDYQSLLISTPGMETGADYVLYSEGSAEGTSVDGYYGTSAYTPGTKISDITLDSVVTTSGSVQSMGSGMGKGGMGQGQRPDGATAPGGSGTPPARPDGSTPPNMGTPPEGLPDNNSKNQQEGTLENT